MAIPLSELLDGVLTDAIAREQFRLAPEAFLRAAGYHDLDAADVQEALFVLADGSPPAKATQLLAGGRSIGDPGDLDGLDTLDGLAGAGQGLVAAIDAMPLDDMIEPADSDDPAADDPAADEAFGSGTTDPAASAEIDETELLDRDAFGAERPTAPESTDETAAYELHHDADEPPEEFDRSDQQVDDTGDESAADDWDLD